MYGYDYISVGKEDEHDWDAMKPIVIDIIANNFVAEKQLFTEDIAKVSS